MSIHCFLYDLNLLFTVPSMPEAAEHAILHTEVLTCIKFVQSLQRPDSDVIQILQQNSFERSVSLFLCFRLLVQKPTLTAPVEPEELLSMVETRP